MIVIDYSAIAIANVFAMPKVEEVSEELMRHMILNSIRKINLQHRSRFGKVVLACDHRSWRKTSCPFYKANRSVGREKSDLDWELLFGILNIVREELESFFPYAVIHEQGAEADDIIAGLVYNTQEFGEGEDVLIVSSDKDFFQLHRYSNVSQFCPRKKKFIGPKSKIEAMDYLFEHICTGDSGDGIPNILSPDDTFTSGGRQNQLRKTKIASWKKDMRTMPVEVARNFSRNELLIDLSKAPEGMHERIIINYKKQYRKDNSKILNYLIVNRCGVLASSAEEFFHKK